MKYLFQLFELREKQIIVVIATLLVLIAIIPIWQVHFPPLQDYPLHLLRQNILAHYSDPAFRYHDVFVATLFPMPYILTDYIVSGLASFLPITTAGKIQLTLYVVLLPLGFFYLLSSLAQSKLALGFFVFPLIYNMHLEKGNLNYALSFPLFLIALGYWWRHHNHATWKSEGMLSGLVFLVYLCHLYTFVYLVFSVVILAIFEFRSVSKVFRNLMPFAPSLLLLALVFINQAMQFSALQIEPSKEPVVIEYSTLKGDLLSAINSKFSWSYLTTFSPARDRRVWIPCFLLFVALFFSKRRRKLDNAFLALLAAFAVAYVLLPQYVHSSDGLGYDFSLRTLIIILLIAPLCVSPPSSTNLRALFLGCLILLSLYSLRGSWKDWRSVGSNLDDYYAMLKQIPAGERASFVVHKDSMYVGNIRPFDYFGSYYYLEKGAVRTTDMGSDLSAPLRAIEYRHSSALRSELESVFFHRAQDRFAWYTIVLLRNQKERVHVLAEKYGFENMFENNSMAVYRRTQDSLPSTLWFQGDYFVMGMKEGYNYLLLWQNPSVARPPSTTENLELIGSRGNASLWRRRNLVAENSAVN